MAIVRACIGWPGCESRSAGDYDRQLESNVPCGSVESMVQYGTFKGRNHDVEAPRLTVDGIEPLSSIFPGEMAAGDRHFAINILYKDHRRFVAVNRYFLLAVGLPITEVLHHRPSFPLPRGLHYITRHRHCWSNPSMAIATRSCTGISSPMMITRIVVPLLLFATIAAARLPATDNNSRNNFTSIHER